MRRPSLREPNGVAATSLYAKDFVRVRLYDALQERKGAFHDLPDEEIGAETTIAGEIARRATLQALVTAYQGGFEEWPSETLRKTVVENLRAKLIERRERHDLPDQEIDAHARLAGLLAKEAAEPAIGEIHRMGVDRAASKADHERATIPSPVTGRKPTAEYGQKIETPSPVLGKKQPS